MGNCLFLRKGETHTAPISGILASTLAVGSTVKLMENGTAVEYLVVHQGRPGAGTSYLYDSSCDGTWLLRKDCYEKRQWHSSNVNNYESSNIHSYLNSTFFNLYGEIEKSIIKNVQIPYFKGTGTSGSVSWGSDGLSEKIFLLSGYEVGFTESVNYRFPTDGLKLDYFVSGNDSSAQAKRIAYMSNNQTYWWMRSPYLGDSNSAWCVYTTGSYDYSNCVNSMGIRPALILPSNALFDKTALILKGVA